jgi:hypothetical protein
MFEDSNAPRSHVNLRFIWPLISADTSTAVTSKLPQSDLLQSAGHLLATMETADYLENTSDAKTICNAISEQCTATWTNPNFQDLFRHRQKSPWRQDHDPGRYASRFPQPCCQLSSGEIVLRLYWLLVQPDQGQWDGAGTPCWIVTGWLAWLCSLRRSLYRSLYLSVPHLTHRFALITPHTWIELCEESWPVTFLMPPWSTGSSAGNLRCEAILWFSSRSFSLDHALSPNC